MVLPVVCSGDWLRPVQFNPCIESLPDRGFRQACSTKCVNDGTSEVFMFKNAFTRGCVPMWKREGGDNSLYGPDSYLIFFEIAPVFEPSTATNHQL